MGNSDIETGVESLAESMWEMIRERSDQDWSWLRRNDPHLAAELRLKARTAIDRAGLVPTGKTSHRGGSVAGMDLRLKEHLTGISR